MRPFLTALAAGAILFGGAGVANADVNIDYHPHTSYTIVFGDWLQFAADDVFNAGHDNTVGSDN
ncbi:hypothetical protein LG634_32825 [Streptomyces bambusae]|uniref:hypothetical protein n=1 Tax=Streptomyces bambusae TaxID=1550616 RepID=UPI001CFFFEC8|nr:hypothetical protein [Streptomyces bambusae]MCB5169578.1 hypothetical protein [Streptomyces bambusae]